MESSLRAVRKTIKQFCVSGNLRSASHVSMPSISGIIRSNTTTSGLNFFANSTAKRPLEAV